MPVKLVPYASVLVEYSLITILKFFLQGWSPEPEEYKDLPQRRPDSYTRNTQSPYIQIDLLKPYNITGKQAHSLHAVHAASVLCALHFVSVLSYRCVDPGWRCVWHICVQLLPPVQPGWKTVVHLQGAGHRCPTQSQGAAANQSALLYFKGFIICPNDCSPPRFFLVIMMIEE